MVRAAVLMERERCAAIADAWALTEADLVSSTNGMMAKAFASVSRETGNLIAKAIRSQP